VTNGFATCASRVQTDEDVVDVLTMALTFDMEARLRNAKRQQGVRCYDGPDLRQRPSTQRLGLGRQADALIVLDNTTPNKDVLRRSRPPVQRRVETGAG
jgi:hypothetical protein